MSDQELKPCPCCGGHAIPIGRVRGIFVQCQSCWLATHFYDTIDAAVKAWNTRTHDPLLEELAGALEKALDHGLFKREHITEISHVWEKYQQSKVKP